MEHMVCCARHCRGACSQCFVTEKYYWKGQKDEFCKGSLQLTCVMLLQYRVISIWPAGRIPLAVLTADAMKVGLSDMSAKQQHALCAHRKK